MTARLCLVNLSNQNDEDFNGVFNGKEYTISPGGVITLSNGEEVALTAELVENSEVPYRVTPIGR